MSLSTDSPSAANKTLGLSPSSSRSRLQEYGTLFDPPVKDVFSNQAYLLRKITSVQEIKETKEVRPSRICTLENVESDMMWDKIINFHCHTKLPCVAIVACYDLVTPISKKLRDRFTEIAKKYEDTFFYRMHKETNPIAFNEMKIVSVPTFVAFVHGRSFDRAITEDAKEVLELVRKARKQAIVEELNPPPPPAVTNSPHRTMATLNKSGVMFSGVEDEDDDSPKKGDIAPDSPPTSPRGNPDVPTLSIPVPPVPISSSDDVLRSALKNGSSTPDVSRQPTVDANGHPIRERTQQEIDDARKRNEAALEGILNGIKRSMSRTSNNGELSIPVSDQNSREQLAMQLEDAFQLINDQESLFPEEHALEMKYRRAKQVLRQKEKALRKLHAILMQSGVSPARTHNNTKNKHGRTGNLQSTKGGTFKGRTFKESTMGGTGRYAANPLPPADSDFASSMGDDRSMNDEMSDIMSDLDDSLYGIGSDYDSVFEDEELAAAYQKVNGPLRQVLIQNELKATREEMRRGGKGKEAMLRKKMMQQAAAAGGGRRKRFGWEKQDSDDLSNFSDAYSIEMGEDLEEMEARHKAMEELHQQSKENRAKTIKIIIIVSICIVVVAIPIFLFTLFPELVGGGGGTK